jgi:hypothetical protein
LDGGGLLHLAVGRAGAKAGGGERDDEDCPHFWSPVSDQLKAPS